MKAPLRFAFGWVLYLAIFAAINLPMVVMWQAVKAQPLHISITSAVVALALFIWFFATQLARLWAWCDAPRTPDAQIDQAPQ